MTRRIVLALVALVALAGGAAAHVTELAVLRLAEIGAGRYAVTWEMKPNTEFGAALEPMFPAHCAFEAPTLDCGDKGLVGELGFQGIGRGQSAALFKIRHLDGGLQVHTLTPSEPTARVRPSFDAESWAGLAAVARAYVQIGVEHIMLGVDHLLFVLGLVWIARGGAMLVRTITAFTVAHSLTLAAVTFDWLAVPERFVNAMIALSIVHVGVEIVNARRGRRSLTLSHPWAVAFLFGLLHGLGFAEALVALGLPEGARPAALLAFNAGVEIGQLAFVGAVLALGWAWRTLEFRFSERARLAPAYAIGGLAAFWFIDRTVVLFGA